MLSLPPCHSARVAPLLHPRVNLVLDDFGYTPIALASDRWTSVASWSVVAGISVVVASCAAVARGRWARGWQGRRGKLRRFAQILCNAARNGVELAHEVTPECSHDVHIQCWSGRRRLLASSSAFFCSPSLLADLAFADSATSEDRQCADLFDWAFTNGVKGLENISVQYFSKGGQSIRGVAANKSLQGGQKMPSPIVSIPSRLFLNSSNDLIRKSSFKDLKGRIVWKRWRLPLDVIAYLAAERSKGSNSFWAPWIQAMPTPEEFASFHPLYAPKQVLEKYSSLPISASLQDEEAELVEAWTDLSTWLASRGLEAVSLADFKWAAVTFYTRCVTLDLEVPESAALVPFLDMTNTEASGAANTGWIYDKDSLTTMVPFQKKIERGAEITITYGSPTTVSFQLPKKVSPP